MSCSNAVVCGMRYVVWARIANSHQMEDRSPRSPRSPLKPPTVNVAHLPQKGEKVHTLYSPKVPKAPAPSPEIMFEQNPSGKAVASGGLQAKEPSRVGWGGIIRTVRSKLSRVAKLTIQPIKPKYNIIPIKPKYSIIIKAEYTINRWKCHNLDHTEILYRYNTLETEAKRNTNENSKRKPNHERVTSPSTSLFTRHAPPPSRESTSVESYVASACISTLAIGRRQSHGHEGIPIAIQ
eukprot:1049492-Amorphochlora_amoeboformis.AAC.1